jgi:hypothetical protein
MILWGQKHSPNGDVVGTLERDGFVFVASRDLVPDYVRLPEQLGGAQERVTRAVEGRCPLCDREVRHLLCQTASVAECAACGFVWYRRKPGDDA